MAVRRLGWFVLLLAAVCHGESSLRGRLLHGEDVAPPPFQPGDISIGEPLQLPSQPFPPARVAPQPTVESHPDAGEQPAAGNGWIGLTADDKVVTGRLVVVDVATAGPAHRAGIRVDDHLLAIDGVPLRSADQLAAALAAIAPGNTVKVAIGRGTQIDELSIVARSRPTKAPVREPAPQPTRGWQAADTSAPPTAAVPATPTPAPAGMPSPAEFDPPAPASGRGRTALGVRTLPVDPSAQERFRLAEPAGALVIGVVQDLPASKAGVPPGSVIVALDNQPVRSPSELTRIVTSGPVGRPVTLQYILPGGEQRRAQVSLQSLEVPLEKALVGPQP